MLVESILRRFDGGEGQTRDLFYPALCQLMFREQGSGGKKQINMGKLIRKKKFDMTL